MNNKKIIIIAIAIIVIAAVILAIVLTGKKYDNTLSAKELYSKIENSITTDGGVRILDDDVILEFTDDTPSYLLDYTVVRAKNAKNINEIGIFKVENGKAKELKPIIEKYLKEKQESYRAMDYFPEEVEKIDFATVKVFGNYVIFSFLNEADTNAFYKAIENELIKS